MKLECYKFCAYIYIYITWEIPMRMGAWLIIIRYCCGKQYELPLNRFLIKDLHHKLNLLCHLPLPSIIDDKIRIHLFFNPVSKNKFDPHLFSQSPPTKNLDPHLDFDNPITGHPYGSRVNAFFVNMFAVFLYTVTMKRPNYAQCSWPRKIHNFNDMALQH